MVLCRNEWIQNKPVSSIYRLKNVVNQEKDGTGESAAQQQRDSSRPKNKDTSFSTFYGKKSTKVDFSPISCKKAPFYTRNGHF